MLSGDNATTAEALANKLDIALDRVIASMLPEDKVTKVRELQAKGAIVAMIGDGINDSPALVQSNLGIAIGAGTQIAIESASMVLIRSNLNDLVVAFDLARVVFQRIKWNFLWACLYNFISVPFAAGIWFPWTRMLLPPHYAGLAMATSSISVVISSMLLKTYKRPQSLLESADPINATSSTFCGSCSAFLGAMFTNSSSHQNNLVVHGYNQLPITDREAEEFLGIELGLGRVNPVQRNRFWKFNQELDDLMV